MRYLIMFIYDDESQSYYCDEYQFYGLSSITMQDIILMIENGEIEWTLLNKKLDGRHVRLKG